MEQRTARRAHNSEVIGSNPVPATRSVRTVWSVRFPVKEEVTGSSPVRIARAASSSGRTLARQARGSGFESHAVHQGNVAERPKALAC